MQARHASPTSPDSNGKSTKNASEFRRRRWFLTLTAAVLGVFLMILGSQFILLGTRPDTPQADILLPLGVVFVVVGATMDILGYVKLADHRSLKPQASSLFRTVSRVQS